MKRYIIKGHILIPYEVVIEDEDVNTINQAVQLAEYNLKMDCGHGDEIDVDIFRDACRNNEIVFHLNHVEES